MKSSLLLISGFVAICGVWLAVMENILMHPGHSGRTLLDIYIILQAVAISAFAVMNSRPIFRYIISAVGLGALLLGSVSIAGMLRGSHFEAYILIVGAALILEGLLTPWYALKAA